MVLNRIIQGHPVETCSRCQQYLQSGLVFNVHVINESFEKAHQHGGQVLSMIRAIAP